MSLLRRMPHFARLVLAVWLLALGVAIASPVVQPPRLEMICSGGVMKPLVQDDGQPATNPSLDCPLCVALGGPLANPGLGVHVKPVPTALAPLATWPARARLVADRPPVRGPPAVTSLV